MPDNYGNNIPPVPPLDVALTRLFDLDPTRDTLAHYRTNRHLLKDGALRWWGGIINGARSNEFTVTNVFSSEEPGLSIHDIVHRDYLDLENLPPDLPRMWRQTAGCDEAEDVDIWSICFWLHAAWMSALDAYEAEPASLSDPGPRGGLFLHPRLDSLPARPLIDELYNDRAWANLVLLTARHELGWYYLKVKTWHTTAQGLSDLSDTSLGVCLAADELEELSMRTHGYYYYKLTATDSTDVEYHDFPTVERRDAPRQVFSAASDVARLYYLLTQWYLKTYNQTVRAPRCTWEGGCQNLLPKYTGHGARPQLCRRHVQESKRASKRAYEGKRRSNQAARSPSSRTRK